MTSGNRSTEILSMIRDIEAETRYTANLTGRKTLDPRVIAAMRAVPRHEFVPIHLRHSAYANGPLPVGHGQTISQPYIVALMTDLLDTRPEHRVLEVGTGCGYQSAVLAGLVEHVFSVEIVAELAADSRSRLDRLGITNVSILAGDGYYGWPEHAPFDGVIVTAAAPSVPTPLLQQIRAGGKLVVPLGTPPFAQELTVVEKGDEGKTSSRRILPVAFVPFTGKHGQER